MKKIATIISAIFSPLFIPTYAVTLALLTTILTYVDWSTKIWVIATTLAITGVAPMVVIFCLHKFGKLSDVGLNKREDRLVPYGISMLCYLGEILFLWKAHSPMWLTMFMAGGTVALLIDMLINLKWKISAHASGMGGLLALGFCTLSRSLNVWPMQWMVMTLVILTGIVCTCRLILERHTLGQLAAGLAVGFCSVTAAIYFS